MQAHNYLSVRTVFNHKFNRWEYDAYRMYHEGNTPITSTAWCNTLEDALTAVNIDEQTVWNIVQKFNDINAKPKEEVYMIKLAEGKEPIII